MSSVETPPDQPSLVIAVDGTSGSGKSSTSRGVADRLGLRYLDTGAMFRAVTWWLLREGIDVRDEAAVAAAVGRPRIASGTDPLAPTITVDGVDVSVEIRGEDVTAAVSPVSAVPEVRARLLRRRTVRPHTSAHQLDPSSALTSANEHPDRSTPCVASASLPPLR